MKRKHFSKKNKGSNEIKHLLKVASQWYRRYISVVTIHCRPGIYTEDIRLVSGVLLNGRED